MQLFTKRLDMLLQKSLILILSTLTIFSTNAQLFETRSSHYSGQKILDKFEELGTSEQKGVMEEKVSLYRGTLANNEHLVTYFDDFNVGLVIYRDSKPNKLIGFWNPEGKELNGGELENGKGTVLTPFNPNIVSVFETESVEYKNGRKNGPVFYYCDCASVLRKGNFVDNQKEGLWKEFTPKGEFVEQKRIRLATVVEKEKIKDIDLLQPAHCMMRNPDELHIICPNKQ